MLMINLGSITPIGKASRRLNPRFLDQKNHYHPEMGGINESLSKRCMAPNRGCGCRSLFAASNRPLRGIGFWDSPRSLAVVKLPSSAWMVIAIVLDSDFFAPSKAAFHKEATVSLTFFARLLDGPLTDGPHIRLRQIATKYPVGYLTLYPHRVYYAVHG